MIDCWSEAYTKPFRLRSKLGSRFFSYFCLGLAQSAKRILTDLAWSNTEEAGRKCPTHGVGWCPPGEVNYPMMLVMAASGDSRPLYGARQFTKLILVQYPHHPCHNPIKKPSVVSPIFQLKKPEIQQTWLLPSLRASKETHSLNYRLGGLGI